MRQKLKEEEYNLSNQFKQKLQNPNSLYAKNPVMQKGVLDVERLGTSAAQEVAKKLQQITGISNINEDSVKTMLFSELMPTVNQIMSIELQYKDELEDLAVEVSLEESQIPEDWYEIEAVLSRSYNGSYELTHEYGDEGPDTKISANGFIFPVLCHEIIKGIEEAKARFGYPENPDVAKSVLSKSDKMTNEPDQLMIGPEIVKKIRTILPDAVFEDYNTGLINWFQIVLYKMPAKQFITLIGNAISDDPSKVNIAKRRFNDLMDSALEYKEEYDNYIKENPPKYKHTRKTPDNLGDVDDFLSDLGLD